MPLVQSPSEEAFEENLRTELAHGKPKEQALAIAYETQRANDCADMPQSLVKDEIMQRADGWN